MAEIFDSYYKRVVLAVSGALAIGAAACDDDSATPPGGGVVATRPSHGSTIALSEDSARVAMVNPDDGTLSVFETSDNVRISKTPTGGNPSSVVITADGKSAFVANRADGTVVRVTGIDGGTPAIDATIDVGAEPAGLALSPTGKLLFVAEYAQSRVAVIDTQTMKLSTSIAVDRPRALLVTNNADEKDEDETLAIAQYFGVPVAGREAKDDGRTGRIVTVKLDKLSEQGAITLAPIDTGFPKGGVAGNPNVGAAPNQLTAMATANGRLYITSVAASPEGPTRFDNNVFPVVYVADLGSGVEIRDASGTTNLARKIYDAIPTPSAASPRFIPGELSDIDFLDGSNVGYTVGRAGDVMVRITAGDSIEIGSTQNKEIDLAGNDTLGKCQGPIGVAVSKDLGKAFVNCWITRRLAVVDLGAQQLAQTVEASPAPANAAEAQVQRGKRFYFTGRARWSAAVANGAKGGEGWSSCGSCHPDGLTDNMTWIFGAGPRQTTSMDGTFSHGPGSQKERILNWTGIFDELHDFERNTRDVSGGLGAITTAAVTTDCNQLDKESQVALAIAGTPIGGLGKPLKELADDATVATCGHKDWDDIDAFVKTIAPVHHSKLADTAQLERGKQLFVAGGCAKCHGGQGWTVSRRFFVPSGVTNGGLTSAQFLRPPFFAQTLVYDNGATPRTLVSAQPPVARDATGPDEPAAIPVAQVACSLRNVGSFGIPNDDAATNALELRPANGMLVRAEGRAGFNVPSLYGLALGAPYLHHGQAATLTDLFTDPQWGFHTNAGNANFSVSLGAAGAVDDLDAYLLSIDATTAEIAVPNDPGTGASFDVCPVSFQ